MWNRIANCLRPICVQWLRKGIGHAGGLAPGRWQIEKKGPASCTIPAHDVTICSTCGSRCDIGTKAYEARTCSLGFLGKNWARFLGKNRTKKQQLPPRLATHDTKGENRFLFLGRGTPYSSSNVNQHLHFQMGGSVP